MFQSCIFIHLLLPSAPSSLFLMSHIWKKKPIIVTLTWLAQRTNFMGFTRILTHHTESSPIESLVTSMLISTGLFVFNLKPMFLRDPGRVLLRLWHSVFDRELKRAAGEPETRHFLVTGSVSSAIWSVCGSCFQHRDWLWSDMVTFAWGCCDGGVLENSSVLSLIYSCHCIVELLPVALQLLLQQVLAEGLKRFISFWHLLMQR